MNFIYKEFSKEHLDSIVLLDKICFKLCWSKNIFINELNKNNSKYYVALHNDEVIGYVGANYVLDEADITNIAVLPDFRNKKIASHLMDMMIKHLKTINILKLNLEVRQSNIGAINLYKKFGFEIVGSRKNYYQDNNETAILMTKIL